MEARQTAILNLIQHRAITQGFNDDMRLVGEAIAIRAFKAGASAHRAVTEGIQASYQLARISHSNS